MTAYDKIKDRGIYTSDEEETDQAVMEEPSSQENQSPNPMFRPNGPSQEAPEESQPASNSDFFEEEEENINAIDDEPYSENNQLDMDIIANDLKEETIMLLDFALYNGKQIPSKISKNLHTKRLSILMGIHKELCALVAPATPKTIDYLSSFSKEGRRKSFLSPIPLMRNLILAAIISIFTLIGCGLSPEVNADKLSQGILVNSGISLLLNLLFLCSAAGIGSIFFLLSRLSKEIKKGSLSKEDVSHYWARLIMGILSGLILSELIVVKDGIENASVEIDRLFYALMGGFASEIMYNILEELMAKVQAVIVGTSSD